MFNVRCSVAHIKSSDSLHIHRTKEKTKIVKLTADQEMSLSKVIYQLADTDDYPLQFLDYQYKVSDVRTATKLNPV